MLEAILKKYPSNEEYLIEILLDYHGMKKDHSVTNDEIERIAKYLNVSESKVCSVISFYSLFSTKKKGRYIIQVCKDVPCYISEGTNILKTLERLIGIKVGETTNNLMFSLEYTSCLGCCDKAPAMRIDGQTYTKLTPEKVKAIISEYRGKDNE